MEEIRFRLPSSLRQRVALPNHKVMSSGSCATVSGNRFNLILQFTFYQLRRWRLNLPEEFRRLIIPLQLAYMEGGVDLPTWGQIQLVHNYRYDSGDGKRAHPLPLQPCGKMRGVCFQMVFGRDHFITHLKLFRLP